MTNKRSVLVIEDDEAQAGLLEEFFRVSGFQVHMAVNGQQGLQRAMDVRPDIILLDLVLPDMNGADVCAQLRASISTQHIPIILCSAYQITAVDKIRGFRAGADDYLVRPFELSELLARMQAIFRRSNLQLKEDTLARINSVVRQTPAPPTPGPTTKKIPSVPMPPSAPRTQPLRVSSSSKPTAPPVPPSAKAPGTTAINAREIIKRIWEILNGPRHVFSTINEGEDFFVAVLLVLGTPTLLSFSRLFGRGGSFDAWIGVFSLGIVIHLIMWGGVAGILHMALPFQGINLPMRQALTLAGLAWAPRILHALLKLIYGIFASGTLAGEGGGFSSGIDLVPFLPSSGIISFLSHIGIFDLWATGLVLIGVWNLTNAGRRQWNTITVLVGFACLLIGTLSNL